MSPTCHKGIIYCKNKYSLCKYIIPQRKNGRYGLNRIWVGLRIGQEALGERKNLIYPATKGDVPELTYMCTFHLIIYVRHI